LHVKNRLPPDTPSQSPTPSFSYATPMRAPATHTTSCATAHAGQGAQAYDTPTAARPPTRMRAGGGGRRRADTGISTTEHTHTCTQAHMRDVCARARDPQSARRRRRRRHRRWHAAHNPTAVARAHAPEPHPKHIKRYTNTHKHTHDLNVARAPQERAGGSARTIARNAHAHKGTHSPLPTSTNSALVHARQNINRAPTRAHSTRRARLHSCAGAAAAAARPPEQPTDATNSHGAPAHTHARARARAPSSPSTTPLYMTVASCFPFTSTLDPTGCGTLAPPPISSALCLHDHRRHQPACVSVHAHAARPRRRKRAHETHESHVHTCAGTRRERTSQPRMRTHNNQPPHACDHHNCQSPRRRQLAHHTPHDRAPARHTHTHTHTQTARTRPQAQRRHTRRQAQTRALATERALPLESLGFGKLSESESRAFRDSSHVPGTR
jgi:hypothetical protein